MHRLTLLLSLLTLTAALPLNINLGAYSPAIVVGDGAISFGGAEEGAEGAEGTNAAQLINALQGAAVGTAGAAAGAGRVNGAATGITVNAAAAAGDGPGVVQAAAAPRPILNDPVCCRSLSFVFRLFLLGLGCWGEMGCADAEGG